MRTLMCIFIVMCVVCSTVRAQDMMGRLMRPVRPGSSTFLRLSAFHTEAADADGTDVSIRGFDAGAGFSRASESAREWTVFSSITGFDIEDPIVLPDSGMRLDDTLYDVEFGLGYRRMMQDDMIGGFASAGSASDRPFNSYDELSLMVNVFYKYTRSPVSSWMFLANYSNRRSFLPHVPLPGAAYIYQPGRRTLIVAGMPFFMARFPAGKSTDIMLRYFIPDQVKLESATRLGRGFSLLAGGERDETSFFLSDRDQKEDALFYLENRVYGGLQWADRGSTEIRCTVGYAMDRHFFQGEDDDEDDIDRVNLDDAADLRISVSRRF